MYVHVCRVYVHQPSWSSLGWDHRGTTSEVGVGFRLMDDLPADREAFSDVGTPGQLPAANPHRVYKQV